MPFGEIPELSLRQYEHLIATAIEQCPLLKTGDSRWLHNPSIRNALVFMAHIYKDDKRTYGGLLKLTHALRSAHRAFNYGPREGYEQHSIEVAFVALLHDGVEDFPGRTGLHDKDVLDFIMNGWAGDPAKAKPIRRDIWSLTDSYGLGREARRAEQFGRINFCDPAGMNYSSRAMVIRYLEKLDSLEGDLESAILSNLKPKVIRELADLGIGNLALIESMSGAVGDHEKARYTDGIYQLVALARGKGLEVRFDGRQLMRPAANS